LIGFEAVSDAMVVLEYRAILRIEQPVVWKFPDGVIMHPGIPI
jgi:hypothetical protein